MLLKNREFRIRVNKINDAEEFEPEHDEPTLLDDPERLNEIAQDFIKTSAVVIGATFAAVKILGAVCDIAVNMSKPEK